MQKKFHKTFFSQEWKTDHDYIDKYVHPTHTFLYMHVGNRVTWVYNIKKLS